MWKSILKKGFICFSLTALCFLSTASHAKKTNNLEDPISQQIQSFLNKRQIINFHAIKALSQFYLNRSYLPAWSQNKAPTKNAYSLLRAIKGSYNEGLIPDDYHLEQLNNLLNTIEAKKGDQVKDLAMLDLLLTDAYLTLASNYYSGLFRPEARVPVWFREHKDKDFISLLQNALTTNKIQSSLINLLPKNKSYLTLKEALPQFEKLAKTVTWPKVPSGSKLQLNAEDERVIAVRKRLEKEDYLRLSKENKPTLFDTHVEKALKDFQSVHGLDPDGVVGPGTLLALNVSPQERLCQIRVNLDRQRAFPKNPGDSYVHVNIPGFELNVIKGNHSVLEMKTIVGRPDRPTPLFSHQIQYMVLNPYWTIPKTIAVKDKLKIIKEDPSWFAQQNMKLYSGAGKDKVEVDPQTVDWSSVSSDNYNFSIVQDPGYGNALGTIKFMFPNQYEVYLHDTPSRYLFKQSIRTFSSGCVRIEKPLELAELLLKPISDWDRQSLEKSIKNNERKMIKLVQPIPIHLTYHTAWVDQQDQLQFRGDIYKYDEILGKTLCREPKTLESSNQIALKPL